MDFNKGIIAAHNAKRRIHGAPDLVYNATLAASAQDWANRCHFAHGSDGVLKWGECLEAGSMPPGNGSVAVDYWYSESQGYDYTKEVDDSHPAQAAGHFVQMIWKSTSSIGCAYAACSEDQMQMPGLGPKGNFIVYYTYGGVAGEYVANVLPPKPGMQDVTDPSKMGTLKGVRLGGDFHGYDHH
ncbi:uncharacterized protein PFL1_02956 [Pseudozyma flocculosa PF-1]|nr:uncharacterized protein PFL1_02956 [Pseudozyma flocculosa PF-1]EPQ29736.1 hypothetical protein PFL1_02956 [Pseudozyma flocculosa PF-1]